MIGSPAAEMGSLISEMLRQALHKKLALYKKDNWRRWGAFSQRWLLLLNCCPLVDDAAQVHGALSELSIQDSGLTGFDGVFWSGYPDRTLIPMPLVQRR
jgi:hypothetical protein